MDTFRILKKLGRPLLAAILGSLLAAAPGSAPAGLAGWIPYWGLPAGLDSARSANGRLTDAFLFAVNLDDAGSPSLACPESALSGTCAELRRLGVRTWLTVVNDREGAGKEILKDPAIVHSILASDTLRPAHVSRLVELCRKFGVQGLDLDYENLDLEDRAAFSRFVEELGVALHARKLQLSVTLEAKTRETGTGAGRAADWEQLGRVADRLQIMLYNLHYRGSAPGPVATPDWIDQVMGFAESRCPKAKLIPALKVSGFEWGPRPRGITFRELDRQRQSDHTEFQREPEGDTPYLGYTLGGASRVAFCDDARSLEAKIQYLQRRGYSSAILWSLGVEDPLLWSNPDPHPAP